MKLKTLKDLNVKNKTVILRVAFDVPLEKGKVVDDSRLYASIPTIRYLQKQNAKIVLLAYLGRPKGKKVKELKLDPVAKRLSEILGEKVNKLDDCIGFKVQKFISKMKPKEIVLLENTRFHPEEDKNDSDFAKKLSLLGDVFVNDAFAQSHRDCASIVGITKFLPSVAGLLLEKEIRTLSSIFEKPKKPLVFVLGGAKISTKIELLKNLLPKIDVFLVGGGMANTFLKAQGFEVGKSLVENEMLEEAEEILEAAHDNETEFLLPEDVVVAKNIEDEESQDKDLIEVKEEDIIGDIGPKTIASFVPPIKFAGTIIWNGPLGIFEVEKFSHGTTAITKIIAQNQAFKIAGGGDTLAAIKEIGLVESFNFLSTGGGAMMDFLSDKELPGIKVLEK